MKTFQRKDFMLLRLLLGDQTPLVATPPRGAHAQISFGKITSLAPALGKVPTKVRSASHRHECRAERGGRGAAIGVLNLVEAEFPEHYPPVPQIFIEALLPQCLASGTELEGADRALAAPVAEKGVTVRCTDQGCARGEGTGGPQGQEPPPSLLASGQRRTCRGRDASARLFKE